MAEILREYEDRLDELFELLTLCQTGMKTKIPIILFGSCLLYTSPSPRDGQISRMPSSA